MGDFRAAGFSGSKTAALKDLAAKAIEGVVPDRETLLSLRRRGVLPEVVLPPALQVRLPAPPQARPAAPDDVQTRGIQEFNRLVYASKDLYPVLIPLRDGVTVCRKQ